MTLPPILRMPVELHLDILVKLELHDRVSLAFTNRYFRSITPPPSHNDFLAAEAGTWATARHLYACKGCVRFRRYEEFADDMKKGKRCRSLIDANTRFCLKCGVAGSYALGTHLIICGRSHVLCQVCGSLSDQIGSQGVCARCSPDSRWTYTRARTLRSNQFDQEDEWSCTTKRSSDGRHPQEYGGWPEV